jgi:hypothetical protein
MPDSRMRDDGVFRDNLNAVVDEVIEAFQAEWLDLAQDEMTGADKNMAEQAAELVLGPFAPSYDDSLFDGIPYDGFPEFEEHTRNLFKQFRGFNISGGTNEVHQQLLSGVTTPLEAVADVKFLGSRPTDVIDDKLVDWTGPADSAAYVFQTSIMPETISALVYQLDMARSLQAVIVMHESIVLAAREGILGVADDTLRALGEARQARSEAGAAFLKDTAELALTAIFSAASGPAATIRATLEKVGSTMINGGFGVSGNGFKEVSRSMEDAIASLASSIRAEEQVVQDALNQVISYVTYTGGSRDESLPPNVNPPAPVLSPHYGPF